MAKTITLKIKSSEVFYDILNKTYLTGRSRSELTPETVSSLTASEDDEDMNQIKRSFKESCAVLVSRLSELATDDAVVDTDTLDGVSDLEIELHMPSNYNPAFNTTAADLCHKFIVGRCCYDWFSITLPDEAKAYYEMSVNALDELIRTIYRRVRPKRSSFVDY